MSQATHLPRGVKLILAFHILNLVLWLFGQTYAVIDYDAAAAWGLQEPRDLVDPAVVEVNRAIGLTDTILMLPVFALAVVALWRMKFLGLVASWLAFGMTMSWPVMFWSSQFFYASGGIRHQPTSPDHVLVSAAFFLFALWASCYLMNNRESFN